MADIERSKSVGGTRRASSDLESESEQQQQQKHVVSTDPTGGHGNEPKPRLRRRSVTTSEDTQPEQRTDDEHVVHKHDDAATKSHVTQDQSKRSRDGVHRKFGELQEDATDWAIGINSIREVFKTDNWFWKSVWIVAGLICLGACGVLSALLIKRSLDKPTATKITYRVNSTLKFPRVTVCTYARLNATEAQRANISSHQLSYMFSSFRGMYWFYNQGLNQRERLREMEAEYQVFKEKQMVTGGAAMRGKNFSLPSYFMRKGIQCEMLLGGCTMQGAVFDCCKDVEEDLSEIGKCFGLRVDPHLQSLPGSIGGLKAYISNWQQSYPVTVINNNQDDGIQIHITHPDTGVLLTTNPVIVFPNTHASIRLRLTQRAMRQKVQGLSGAESCTTGKALKYYPTYSAEACFNECVADLMQKQCECHTIGQVPLKGVDSSKICTPYQATNCLLPLLQESTSSFLWDIYSIQTNCKCPIMCNEWTFDTLVSYTFVPNPGYREARRGLQTKMVGLTSMDNVSYSILDIYYDTMIYQVISETDLFNFSVFISKFGSQLAFWLGIRFLTLIQAVYYFSAFSALAIPYAFSRCLRKLGWSRDHTVHHKQEAEHDESKGSGTTVSDHVVNEVQHSWSDRFTSLVFNRGDQPSTPTAGGGSLTPSRLHSARQSVAGGKSDVVLKVE